MTSSRSPRPTSKLKSEKTSFAPKTFHSAVAVRTVHAAGVGSEKRSSQAGAVASVPGRARSRFLATRRSSVWATGARFAVWPRIASASVESRRISALCRFAVFSCRCSSTSRTAARYSEYVPLYSITSARSIVGGAVDVHHTRDHVVEQVEVMTRDNERASVSAQHRQQPRPHVGIEVVGGLVEQEQLAPSEQDAHELEAPPLPAGECPQRDIDAVVGEPDAHGEPPDLRLRGVAARGLEAFLELGEARDVRLRRVLVDRDPGLLEVVLKPVETLAREDVAEAARVVGHHVGPRILREVPRGLRAPNGVPSGARRRRQGQRKRVVLPAPLRPTSPIFSPGPTWVVTASTIVVPPISTERSRMVSTRIVLTSWPTCSLGRRSGALHVAHAGRHCPRLSCGSGGARGVPQQASTEALDTQLECTSRPGSSTLCGQGREPLSELASCGLLRTRTRRCPGRTTRVGSSRER